jgi:hypothetical protein
VATFGKTTNGTSSSSSSGDRVWVSAAIPGSTGTVQTGHARLWLSGAGSTSVKFVIYSSITGPFGTPVPGNLLAESDVLTLTATTEGERTFTFSGANLISVTSGTRYFVGCAWQDPGTISISFSRSSVTEGRFEQSFTWPTVPTSYGTPIANTSGPVDAYITYSGATQTGAVSLVATATCTIYVGTTKHVSNIYPSSTTFPSATLFPHGGGIIAVATSTLSVGGAHSNASAFVVQPTITIGSADVSSQWISSQEHPAGVYSVVLEGGGDTHEGVVSLQVDATLLSGQIVGGGAVSLSVPTTATIVPTKIVPVFPITGTFTITNADNVGTFIIALESIPVQHPAVVSMVVNSTIDIAENRHLGTVSLTATSTFSAKSENFGNILLTVIPTIAVLSQIKERVALVAVATMTIQGPIYVAVSAVQLSVAARIHVVGRRQKAPIYRTNFPYPPLPHGFRVIAQKILTGEIIDWELPVSDDFEYTRQLSGPTLIKGSFKPEIESVQQLNLDGYAVMFHVEIDNIIRASGIMLPPQYSESALNFTCEGVAAIPHYAQWEDTFSGINIDAFDIVRSIWSHVQAHPNLDLDVTLPNHLAGRTFGDPSAIEVLDSSNNVIATFIETPRLRAARLILDRLSAVNPTLPINEDWTWDGMPEVVGEWNDDLLADFEANGPAESEDPTAPNEITWLTKLVSDFDGLVPEGSETRLKDPEPYELQWYNGTNCGEEFDKLAGDTPFDYIEHSGWNAAKTDVEFFLDLGFPRLGTQRTDLLFNEDNLLEVIPAQEGEDTYASAVLVVGAGEGAATIRGYAAQNFGERVGKTVVITDKSITTTERANAVAVQELGIRRGKTFEIDEVVVQANHQNAPLGSYDVGDDIQVEVFVPWLSYLHRDWYRITSITFQPTRDHVRLGIQRSSSFRYPVLTEAVTV